MIHHVIFKQVRWSIVYFSPPQLSLSKINFLLHVPLTTITNYFETVKKYILPYRSCDLMTVHFLLVIIRRCHGVKEKSLTIFFWPFGDSLINHWNNKICFLLTHERVEKYATRTQEFFSNLFQSHPIAWFYYFFWWFKV